MKKSLYYLFFIIFCTSCNFEAQAQKNSTAQKPLNITIYLDLSDRLNNGAGGIHEPQMLRDTALISHIVDKFINSVVSRKIVPCTDNFRIVFYPTTGISGASDISNKLSFDLGQVQPADKKRLLLSMKTTIQNNLSHIYNETIQNKNWVGSDIWGYFDSKIGISCVKKDYRNVLFVLTDGYIYHKASAVSFGNNTYSYLTCSVINRPDMKLQPGSKKLPNLEVMFLELNPQPQTDLHKQKRIIGTWLDSMDIKHYDIVETDVTGNTKDAIDNFLRNNE